VSSIRFQLDKPRTVQQVLQELPEAVRLCAEGCEIDEDYSGVIAVPGTGDSYLSFSFVDHKAPFEAHGSQVAYVWMEKKNDLTDTERELIDVTMTRAAQDCYENIRLEVRAEIAKLHDLSAKANYLKQLSEMEAKCKARNADSSPKLSTRPQN
jgi:hypothetical protein